MCVLDSIRTYSSTAHISLCIQFLAFTAAACFVAVIMESAMKYDAAKNKKILQGRLKTSLGVENAWYTLSLNGSFYDRNPRVVAVWDMVSISRKDFKGLVEAHDMWIKGKKSWDDILHSVWGFQHFLIERHADIFWVNFHPEAKGCPIAPFYKGTSPLHPARGMLFPDSKNRDNESGPSGWLVIL